MIEKLEQRLNAKTRQERIAALKELMSRYNSGEFKKPTTTDYVNNHVHTIYSFSPYSPTSAAYTAWKNGLATVGIMDHDSIAGAHEFVEAGEIIGIGATCGIELRCKLEGTPFMGRRTNNPDQNTVTYLAAHGIPHQSIDKVQEWISPYRAQREARNRKMVDKIGDILKDTPIVLDYDKDVRPMSQAAGGGSVTERHILYALSYKITEEYGRGGATLSFLKDQLEITVTGNILNMLTDSENPYYEYYLLGVLKSSMVEQFYVDAYDECPTIKEFTQFIRSIGGVPAYPYLGDVGDSVTGDKKTQTFEDAYLDELVAWLPENGFCALTFMPTRNTPVQLERLMGLCDKYNLFQISGEDINTPFQSFICSALDKPEFHHLIDATWALIGHELSATEHLEAGMFSDTTLKNMPDLTSRIEVFKQKGLKLSQNS